MQVRLDGRVALVTGGSLGIGRAIAAMFAGSGARLAIVARRPDTLDEAAQAIRDATGSEIVSIAADVSTAEGCEHAIDRAQAALGPIDILVNNAGSSKRGPFEEHDDAVRQADLDLKLFAAIRLCRLAMPGMAERKWGRIVNVLAVSAKTPGAGSVPTSVSRAAGMALTKVLSAEGAPDNILVNAMLVGLIRSGQHERRHQRTAPEKSFDEYIAPMAEKLPIGRIGEPEEFANLACFLVSDAASYVTGCAINVDGGRSPVV